jgi:hypothetical protein
MESQVGADKVLGGVGDSGASNFFLKFRILSCLRSTLSQFMCFT